MKRFPILFEYILCAQACISPRDPNSPMQVLSRGFKAHSGCYLYIYLDPPGKKSAEVDPMWIQGCPISKFRVGTQSFGFSPLAPLGP